MASKIRCVAGHQARWQESSRWRPHKSARVHVRVTGHRSVSRVPNLLWVMCLKCGCLSVCFSNGRCERLSKTAALDLAPWLTPDTCMLASHLTGSQAHRLTGGTKKNRDALQRAAVSANSPTNRSHACMRRPRSRLLTSMDIGIWLPGGLCGSNSAAWCIDL